SAHYAEITVRKKKLEHEEPQTKGSKHIEARERLPLVALSERLLFIAVHGHLMAVASLVLEHRLSLEFEEYVEHYFIHVSIYHLKPIFMFREFSHFISLACGIIVPGPGDEPLGGFVKLIKIAADGKEVCLVVLVALVTKGETLALRMTGVDFEEWDDAYLIYDSSCFLLFGDEFFLFTRMQRRYHVGLSNKLQCDTVKRIFDWHQTTCVSALTVTF
ncbi:hypothetical protein MJT46_009663, partial [Ovis ammon polii x Ovis aries]